MAKPDWYCPGCGMGYIATESNFPGTFGTATVVCARPGCKTQVEITKEHRTFPLPHYIYKARAR